MTDEIHLIEQAFVESMSDHYKRASEELLHAYQRNKEAARHHDAGALKAAVHHAKLSRHHAFNAHEHLKEALHVAEKIQAMPTRTPMHGLGRSGGALQ
jgi:hypothetical protein